MTDHVCLDRKSRNCIALCYSIDSTTIYTHNVLRQKRKPMINSTVFIFFTFNVLCLKISSIACKFLYITTHNCIDAVTMIVSVYQQQNQSINIVMAHSLVYQNIVCMKMIFMTACKFLYITTKTAMMYPN